MRTLTVSTLFRDTPHTRSASPRRVPHLRLTGAWLAAAGFPPGARGHVAHTHGQLVITPKSHVEFSPTSKGAGNV